MEEILGDLGLDWNQDRNIRHLLEKMRDHGLVLPDSKSKAMQEDDRVWACLPVPIGRNTKKVPAKT